MSTNKPIVNFIDNAEFYEVEYFKDNELLSSEVARVFVTNHPKLGNGIIHTSIIKQKFDDGSFETLNTVYKPIKE